MTRKFLPVLAALAGAACGGSDDGSRMLRFPQAVNAEHPRVVTSEAFAGELRAATNGQLRVQIFPGGQLYGARQAVQAAALGDVELAMEPETHFIPFDDAFRAVDIPFLFENEEHFRRFLDGTFRERVAASLEARGLVLLALWDEGPMVLGHRETILSSPDAFDGTKIRSSGHDLLARSWNEMGATTVRLPIEEVYSALQQGVADAIYTTLYTFVASKFYEVAPKTVIWPSRATYVWAVNRVFWETLSPEDRDTVRRLVEHATARYHESLRASEGEMHRTIEGASGGELHRLDEGELAAFRERAAPLLAEWRSEYAAVLVE